MLTQLTRWVLVAMIAMGIASCSSQKQEAEGASTSAETVAAVVNGDTILVGHVDRVVAQWRQAGQAPVDLSLPLPELSRSALNQLVDRTLLFQEARRKGYQADSLQVQAMLNRFQAQFPTEQARQNALRPVGLDFEGLRRIYEEDLVIQRYIQTDVVPNIEVSDASCRQYYDQNKLQFRNPEKVRARHILFTVDEAADDAEVAAVRARASEILEKARAGQDFVALAKEYSQGPSGPQGGDLGYFEQGKMVPPFDAAAFALEEGDISDLVRTQFGFHIIKLEDRQAASEIPFEHAQTQIRSALQNQQVGSRLQGVVQDLRQGADIQTDL
jgi:peptidyl-prolyl cis-trans isomerase C